MTEQNSKNKSFIGGAVILGIAGIVIKVLGAFFRIPLTNIIGDDGMGYYQTAYPIYNLFLTLAIAGIPTAIARMVSERIALDRKYEAHRVFKVSFGLLFATGVITSSILFFGAGAITNAIREPGAIYCMRAIAPALFFCPLMSSFRGYFQGRQNMNPTAVSQVVEQCFRVAIGLGLAVILLDRGLNIAAAGASFGATAGAFFGFIGIGIVYLRHRNEILAEIADDPKDNIESVKSILSDILIIAIPITIGSAVLPIINTIDTALVKSRLMSIGYSSDLARGLYGQLTGMASPLLNFPQVLLQAVSMSLVPVVASAYKRKEFAFMQKNINMALRYAAILAIPCAVGMSVLAKPIMLLFYPMQKESAVSAAGCLSILAYGVIFLGLTHALTGILQGVGKQIIPVRNLCFGALAKICVTFTLTGIPALNVRGAAFGTVTAYFTAAFLDFLSMKKYTDTKVDYMLTFVKPAVSAGVMGVIVHFVYTFAHGVTGNAVSTVVAIGCGVAVYGIMILATKAITLDEMEGLPKGKKITKILRRFIK
ncbi:MAG: polysaccharide biosynthesis protein [Clostridia bacterium]|nr:polysaccharide biosynthesis protein [Clostridia bacterium]